MGDVCDNGEAIDHHAYSNADETINVASMLKIAIFNHM